MEGFGSNGGRMVRGLGLYGASKAALRFFDDALFQEVEGTSIIAGALQPGMVITGMITDQYQNRPEDWKRAKRIFNIIANRVEDVAPWLVERMLQNTKNGVRFAYTSPTKIMLRFLTAPIIKRKVIDE
jgi:short-subunit dehydrogenase